MTLASTIEVETKTIEVETKSIEVETKIPFVGLYVDIQIA
jgi:hypothetical protein